MPFAATWMDQEIIILSEISQKEKDRYRMSLISGIQNTNQLIYERKTDSQIEQTCGCQGGRRRGEKAWEFEINRGKLSILYIR